MDVRSDEMYIKTEFLVRIVIMGVEYRVSMRQLIVMYLVLHF